METLHAAVQKYLDNYFGPNQVVNGWDIKDLRKVRVDDVTVEVEEKKIFSGNPFQTHVKGEALILERTVNREGNKTAQNELIGFSSILLCRFNNHDEEFEISQVKMLAYKKR